MFPSRYWRYFFYIFVFLLPLQTVLLLREPMIEGMKWQYGTIGLYVTDLLLLGYILRVIREQLSRVSKARILKTPYRIVYVALIEWIICSIFWAPDSTLALYYAAQIELALFVCVIAYSINERGVRVAYLLLFVGAVLEGLLGSVQFLTQSTFVSSWFGMSSHEAWAAGTSVLKLDSGRFLRAYGTLPHPNILGGYLALVLVLSMAYFIPRIRLFQTLQQRLFMGGSIVILLGLVVTFSRTAWASALLGISVVAFWVWRHKENEVKRFGVQYLALLVVSVGVFVGVLHAEVFPRFDQAVVAREESVVDRGILMHQAGVLLHEHPLIGVGGGNYTWALMHWFPNVPVYAAQPVHNVFVLYTVEFGVIGLCLLILCVGVYVSTRNTWEGIKQSVLFWSVLCASLPGLLLDHWMYTSHFGLFFLALCFGLCSNRYQANQEGQAST